MQDFLAFDVALAGGTAGPASPALPMKPFSNTTKSSGNRCGPSLSANQQRGWIVMAVILSAIYRHFLKAAVFGMVATQGVRR
ncbi:hypothetical protein [Bradyrhizobium erythrophlei]|uniref:Uncharacterized protein n=1 Tax=Bradyrhizobium erythrophlei TaxID=1437360 RepID=A0A1M5RG79_9BRAD|nr:hypothetical protein [Bradyrhizobium erythrophlei]SHH25146.1 hypothetical protein SAMN05443248_4214 [Bradyrhizobium erythrophlei]